MPHPRPKLLPRKHTALLATHAFSDRPKLGTGHGEPKPQVSSDWLSGFPQVTWTNGATASGSSGSPLIDLESGKVVGVLTGGFASCARRSQPDYYGRLSAVITCPTCWQLFSIQLCPSAYQPGMQ